MGITIYKYTSHIDWGSEGIGITRPSSGGGPGAVTNIDLSAYYTKAQLITPGRSEVDWTNIINVVLPIASETEVGGIIVGTGLTIDSNGVLNVIGGWGDSSGGGGLAIWGDISGNIIDQIDLQLALGAKLNSTSYTALDVFTKVLTLDGDGSTLDADLLDGQHGSYYATKIHNLVDTTNHPVTGLTTGHVLKALSATTYGFTAPGYVVPTGTPVDNQVAVFTDATTIEGHTGFTYDSATGIVSLAIIDAGDGVGRSLSLYAGDAVGSTGTPGGDLTLKAGDAKTSDSTSHAGVLYLLYGEPYPASTAVLLDAVGDATDIDLIIIQKGAGAIQLGTPGGDANIYGMDICINSTSNTVYIGNKATGCLPAKSAETNVVYYDPATGLLSYGAAGSGGGTTYTFRYSLVESTGNVNLVGDSATPGNSKYYGTNGSGTKGFYDLPAGGGDVLKTGTPVDNQIGVWTNATTLEGTTALSFDGLALQVVADVNANRFVYRYLIGDTAIVSHDAETSTSASSYTLVKTITLADSLLTGRTLRIKFDLKRDTAGPPYAYGRIYKNNVAIGTEHSTSSATYTTYSEDIAGWNPSDTIELHLYASGGTGTAYARDFRLCGSHIATTINEVTGTTS